jgi:hypothetical protein
MIEHSPSDLQFFLGLSCPYTVVFPKVLFTSNNPNPLWEFQMIFPDKTTITTVSITANSGTTE